MDRWAEEAAQEGGLETIIFHADWKKIGRRAGPIRNAEIVASADRLVAFWNGRSRGTLNTLLTAHAAGLPIQILDAAGGEVDIDAALAVATRSSAAAARRKGTGAKA